MYDIDDNKAAVAEGIRNLRKDILNKSFNPEFYDIKCMPKLRLNIIENPQFKDISGKK